jgi:isopenicillin N synthase-like dioxygenase
LKEFWHFGQYVSENSKYASEYIWKCWSKRVTSFNAVGKRHQMLEKRSLCLKCFSLAFRLRWIHFDNFAKTEIHFKTHSLPPITSEPANAIRAAAHGDINLITLLMAQGKGLQVQQRRLDWCNCWTRWISNQCWGLYRYIQTTS